VCNKYNNNNNNKNKNKNNSSSQGSIDFVVHCHGCSAYYASYAAAVATVRLSGARIDGEKLNHIQNESQTPP